MQLSLHLFPALQNGEAIFFFFFFLDDNSKYFLVSRFFSILGHFKKVTNTDIPTSAFGSEVSAASVSFNGVNMKMPLDPLSVVSARL